MAKAPKPPQKQTPQSGNPPHQQHVQVLASKFEGPVPHPEILAGYDRISPGAASKIIEMARIQAEHRQQLELEGQRADIAARDRELEIENARIQGILGNEKLGTVLGSVVALTCVGGGIWSMAHDKHWAVTVAFIGLPVASIINALRSGKQKDE
jgi:uncharacterized membrane protein